MLRSFSPGCSTKLWAVCGALAILSLSLVLAVGCASGGSPAQTQLSGSAKMHTYNEAPDADVAARFFYSPGGDDENTPWNDGRTVWSTAETIPSAAQGKIGLETADDEKPLFDLSYGIVGLGVGKATITASADFYIVNNWDRPITVTGVRAPDEDLVYELPPARQFGQAEGPNGLMYDWLGTAGGSFGDEYKPYFVSWVGARKLLFGTSTPPLTNAQAKTVDDRLAYYLRQAKRNPRIYLETISIEPPNDLVIDRGTKSADTGTVTLTFSASTSVVGWGLLGEATAEMIALAFSTYFGVTVDFTYTP